MFAPMSVEFPLFSSQTGSSPNTVLLPVPMPALVIATEKVTVYA